MFEISFILYKNSMLQNALKIKSSILIFIKFLKYISLCSEEKKLKGGGKIFIFMNAFPV